MNQAQMNSIVRNQLAIDLNCSVEDLCAAGHGFVFVEAGNHPERRPFLRAEQHFEMLTMGGLIVVSATPELLECAKPQLAGKSHDDAFSAPFVYGHSVYYLPDLDHLQRIQAPGGFDYVWAGRDDMERLYEAKGFHNAVCYDLRHPRPDVIAIVAKEGDEIVGMAGASADCRSMWQIGIDVLPTYRGHGIAAYLVNALAHEILSRGIVPYYGTASSNIASQRVAHRTGFMPSWMCVYKTRFDGFETLPSS